MRQQLRQMRCRVMRSWRPKYITHNACKTVTLLNTKAICQYFFKKFIFHSLALYWSLLQYMSCSIVQKSVQSTGRYFNFNFATYFHKRLREFKYLMLANTPMLCLRRYFQFCCLRTQFQTKFLIIYSAESCKIVKSKYFSPI